MRLGYLLFSVILLSSCSKHARYGWLRLDGKVEVGPVAQEDTATADIIALADETRPDVQASDPSVLSAPMLSPANAPQTVTEADPVILAEDSDYYAADRPHPWNKVAVASLPITVIGITVAIILQSTWILGLAGALGLILGLIGGRHARDHEEKGRGFAMAAMIIGATAFFLAALAVAASL